MHNECPATTNVILSREDGEGPGRGMTWGGMTSG